jgi:hypothetical protein
MIGRTVLASLLLAGTVASAVTPAYAGGWTYTGPHGRTVSAWGAGWGTGPHGWGPGPCCYGGGVAAGAIAGLAVGTAVGVAAASRPVVPPPVVYAAPPVVYAPGHYYYAP